MSPRRDEGREAVAAVLDVQILFEDNHCIAVAKPAGMVTTHYQDGAETLDRLVKQYLKEKYHKPGQVFLGVVHRLDRPVSGVVLFARTSKAAARLAEQFRERLVAKVYLAAVEGLPEARAGTIESWLRKDPATGRVSATPAETPGARHAVLDFRVLGATASGGWLEVRPRTGRRHQIRVQLAGLGHPILGDRRYGARTDFVAGAIGLHARSLTFAHPVKKEPVTLTAPLPEAWAVRFPFWAAIDA